MSQWNEAIGVWEASLLMLQFLNSFSGISKSGNERRDMGVFLQTSSAFTSRSQRLIKQWEGMAILSLDILTECVSIANLHGRLYNIVKDSQGQ